MGCLKNITRAIFLTVVIVGFMAFGGQDWIKKQVNDYINPSKDVVLERAQKSEIFQRLIKNLKLKKLPVF